MAGCIPYKELLRLFIKEIQFQVFAVRIEKMLRESEVNPVLFRNAEYRRRCQACKKRLVSAVELIRSLCGGCFSADLRRFPCQSARYLGNPSIERRKKSLNKIVYKPFACLVPCFQQFIGGMNTAITIINRKTSPFRGMLTAAMTFS